MHGHSKVYGLIMLIIFILAFNFCRKAIKRDRDFRKQRDETLRLKLQEELILQKFEIERKLQEQEILRQNEIAMKLKEHKDVCYDLFIFSMNPEANFQTEPIKNDKLNEKKILNLKTMNAGKKENAKTTNSVSEPIIYLFVLVLIYFLMKAASDLSQHYKMRSEEQSGTAGFDRRCSLKSYAERKSSKAHFTRQSSFELRSKCIVPIEEEKNIKPEQFSTICGIQNYQKIELPSLPTVLEKIPEIGSTNSLRHQLIRRSSMPLFTRINSLTEAKFRRSSMEILNPEEGSPRRVRMIHRH